MATAYDMMMNLKEMFGKKNCAGRQVAMRALLNTKMAEGTPVRDLMGTSLVEGWANPTQLLQVVGPTRPSK